jgi:hypothetical protein
MKYLQVLISAELRLQGSGRAKSTGLREKTLLAFATTQRRTESFAVGSSYCGHRSAVDDIFRARYGTGTI